jgi:hypothetical protein
VSAADRDTLNLVRFNGTESYAVERAEYRAYRDEEHDVTRVVFLVRTGESIATLEDTREIGAQPNWEIEWTGKVPVEEAVHPGSVLHVPSGYDEAQGENVTNLYYCEHDGTDNNVIEVLEVGDGTVRARLAGTAVDAAYYDGSKPRMRMEVVTTFRLSATLSRSFC